MVDVYQVAKRKDKYLPLAPAMKRIIVLIYTLQIPKNWLISFNIPKNGRKVCLIGCSEVNSTCYSLPN